MDETLLRLLHRLREGPLAEQVEAARLLTENPPLDDEDLAVKALLVALRSSEIELRSAALAALAAFGAAAQPAAPAIAKLLLTDEESIFAVATTTLARLGPRALEVTQECLLQALQGPDDELCAAAAALARLGPKQAALLDPTAVASARAVLTRAIKYRPAVVRGVAADALLELGAPPSEVRGLVAPLVEEKTRSALGQGEPPSWTGRQWSMAVALALLIVAMLAVTVVLAVRLAPAHPLAVSLMVGLTLTGLGVAIFLYSRCPVCNRPFAGKLVRRELAKQEIQTRVVHAKGRRKTAETEIRNLVIRHYQCRWCAHAYSRTSG